MEPIGKYLKAHNCGYKAFKEGYLIAKNPNQYCSDLAMASWWDSGWQKAERELFAERVKEATGL